MNLRNFTSVKARREALEKELGVSLNNIGSYSLDEKQASSRNCENMVGVVQVPLGIVGPLCIKSAKSQQLKTKSYFVPLATTEGALVASINRGCRALSVSGGATALVQRIGVTRGPVFKVKNAEEALKLKGFIARYFKTLASVAASTSRHLTLMSCAAQPIGHYVFVRMYFDTGDAMGMNMATVATQKIVERIEKETNIACIAIAGNFDIDKKPAWLNAIGMRGWSARAEATLSGETVKEVLKVTPQSLYDVWLAKCMVGSAIAGSLGFNAHYANVVAALFIATGQDPAHVVEGSMGITTMEIRGADVYISVNLPALLVGTVGGGTTLATQQEALQLLGLSGTGKVAEFASVVAGAVLAGELSLLASLAEGSLARAHEQLGRASLKHQNTRT